MAKCVGCDHCDCKQCTCYDDLKDMFNKVLSREIELRNKYDKLLAFIRECDNYHHDCYGLKCFPCEAEELLKELGETE